MEGSFKLGSAKQVVGTLLETQSAEEAMSQNHAYFWHNITLKQNMRSNNQIDA